MASVYLDFSPPDRPGIKKLRIFEAVAKVGPFNQIEEVLQVGSYPDYITSYSTDQAASANNWFQIAWVDDKDVESPRSTPILGGTTLLIGTLVNRVMQRDPSLNEVVVTQEAEAVISWVFNTQDPYDSTLTATYKQLNGMTYLILARSIILREILQTSGSKVTLGLVSMQSATVTDIKKDVQSLIDLANADLGIATSAVFQMEDIQVGLTRKGIEFDQSRLMMWYEIA